MVYPMPRLMTVVALAGHKTHNKNIFDISKTSFQPIQNKNKIIFDEDIINEIVNWVKWGIRVFLLGLLVFNIPMPPSVNSIPPTQLSVIRIGILTTIVAALILNDSSSIALSKSSVNIANAMVKILVETWWINYYHVFDIWWNLHYLNFARQYKFSI